MKGKIRFIIGAILLIFVLLIYSYQLYFPDEMYYDEVYHVKRAVLLAELHQYPHRVSTHPPLWHLFSDEPLHTPGVCNGIRGRVEALANAAKDTEMKDAGLPDIRCLAIEALKALGTDEAKSALWNLILTSADPNIMRAAAHAYRSLI